MWLIFCIFRSYERSELQVHEFVVYIEKVLNVTFHQSTGLWQQLHFSLPIQEEIHKLFKFPEAHRSSHKYLIIVTTDNMKWGLENRKISFYCAWDIHRMLFIPWFHLFDGPYKIIRKIGENAFLLPHYLLFIRLKNIKSSINFFWWLNIFLLTWVNFVKTFNMKEILVCLKMIKINFTHLTVKILMCLMYLFSLKLYLLFEIVFQSS